jgi:hypothetical protein
MKLEHSLLSSEYNKYLPSKYNGQLFLVANDGKAIRRHGRETPISMQTKEVQVSPKMVPTSDSNQQK